MQSLDDVAYTRFSQTRRILKTSTIFRMKEVEIVRQKWHRQTKMKQQQQRQKHSKYFWVKCENRKTHNACIMYREFNLIFEHMQCTKMNGMTPNFIHKNLCVLCMLFIGKCSYQPKYVEYTIKQLTHRFRSNNLMIKDWFRFVIASHKHYAFVSIATLNNWIHEC